jgi:hypothetical protein
MPATEPPSTTEVAEPPAPQCFVTMPIADPDGWSQDTSGRCTRTSSRRRAARRARPKRADEVKQSNLIHLEILQKLLTTTSTLENPWRITVTASLRLPLCCPLMGSRQGTVRNARAWRSEPETPHDQRVTGRWRTAVHRGAQDAVSCPCFSVISR